MPGTILVNDEPMPWRCGMTVADVLRERRYLFPMVVVSVNGSVVHRADWADHVVPDGAVVTVVHLTGGG